MNRLLKHGFALDYWADRQPSKIAIYTENAGISYGNLHKRSSHLANTLRSMGIKPQNNILLYLPNGLEYAIAFFAAVKLDLNIMPAGIHSTCSDLEQMLQTGHPHIALVRDSEKAGHLRALDESLTVLCISSDETDSEPKNIPVTDCSFPKNLTGSCLYIATSGSTGKLKFVSNSYQNELINAALYLHRLQVTHEDIILSALPASHKFGTAALLGSCMAGSTLILPSRFRAEKALALIESHGVTVQYGVPTMYIKERNAWIAAEHKPNISTLRSGIIAGSTGASDIFRWFEETADCRLLNCYGTSEIGGLTMAEYDTPPQTRYQTCGTAFPGAIIDICSPDGYPLSPGELGEIVCQVPWGMKEYLKEPELTAQAFDQQKRFLTGDIGFLDTEGNLTICGRKKNMIIRGGYNIFPAEVELALLKCPDILEACVIGAPDPCLGESICAFVCMKNEAALSFKNVRQQAEQFLAKYKLPDQIIPVKEIPRLANGKYDYKALSSFLDTMHTLPSKLAM